jgi:hypothetical protein
MTKATCTPWKNRENDIMRSIVMTASAVPSGLVQLLGEVIYVSEKCTASIFRVEPPLLS